MADPLARALVDAAMEFHRRRPWTRLDGDAAFLIRVPDEELPLAASVMGQNASEYGLMLLRGTRAFSIMLRMILDDEGPEDVVHDWDMLSATFEPFGMIADELRRPLREAGFSARRENIAPVFMVKRPARNARPPNRTEMRLLLRCLRGVLAADDAGQLAPVPLRRKRRRVFELALAPEGGGRQVSTGLVPWPPVPDEAPAALDPGPGLEALPRRGGRWFATLITAPGQIRGDDRVLRIFVVVDTGQAQVLAHEVLLGADLQPAAAALGRLLRGEVPGQPRGLPQRIGFDIDSLQRAFAPALQALDVEAAAEPAPPFLAELGRELSARSGLEPGGDGGLPQDMAAWKEADRLCTEFLLRELEQVAKSRAITRYFGSKEEARRILEELEDLSPYGAFVEWFVSDYRATHRSQTLVEKLLASNRLNPAARVLLEARRDAELSVYRVDACVPGATLEVEDIFTGERHTVHDRSMSGCGLEGYFLPLRLTRVADWIFPCFAGPPLNESHVSRLLPLLEVARVEAGAAGPRPSAHALGRVWSWYLRSRSQKIELRNTDGDPLELLVAEFRVADAAALQRALAARGDLEGEGDGTWTWTRPGPPAPGAGDNTILGHLELHDDRLLLEVNSRRRLERARQWLEAIPGVRFGSSRAQALEPDQLPPDDRLPPGPPAPMAPELRQALEQRLESMYRAWLDETVPALGNRSPRQACATPEGRRRVAALIRSMAPVHTNGGPIDPPRALLLRELGLES
ncbi:MAG: DUF2384 domain-containing protein [Planctomycetota bacterium]|nr:MAG: DUF2384 domain-containing protein [Planctomycetota bacterium]